MGKKPKGGGGDATTKIIWVRHAQSIANIGKFNPDLDGDAFITNVGISQAQEAGKFLAEYLWVNEVKVCQNVLSSFMPRAAQTASLLGKALDEPVGVLRVPYIHETHSGRGGDLPLTQREKAYGSERATTLESSDASMRYFKKQMQMCRIPHLPVYIGAEVSDLFSVMGADVITRVHSSNARFRSDVLPGIKGGEHVAVVVSHGNFLYKELGIEFNNTDAVLAEYSSDSSARLLSAKRIYKMPARLDVVDEQHGDDTYLLRRNC